MRPPKSKLSGPLGFGGVSSKLGLDFGLPCSTGRKYIVEEQLVFPEKQLYFFSILLCAIAGFLGCCFYGLGGMYGEKRGDETVAEAIWQTLCILLDTGIEFVVVEIPNRCVASFITISGVLFSATLTGFTVDFGPKISSNRNLAHNLNAKVAKKSHWGLRSCLRILRMEIKARRMVFRTHHFTLITLFCRQNLKS